MSQYVHITVGDSTAGSLKHYLKPDKDYYGKIISFIDDLEALTQNFSSDVGLIQVELSNL